MAQIVIDIPNEFIEEVVESLDALYKKPGNQADLDFIKSIMLKKIADMVIDHKSRLAAKTSLDSKKIEFKNKYKDFK